MDVEAWGVDRIRATPEWAYETPKRVCVNAERMGVEWSEAGGPGLAQDSRCGLGMAP